MAPPTDTALGLEWANHVAVFTPLWWGSVPAPPQRLAADLGAADAARPARPGVVRRQPAAA